MKSRLEQLQKFLEDEPTDAFTHRAALALGLAFGERRQLEVALVYLFHPRQEQFSGGVALGYQFSLD